MTMPARSSTVLLDTDVFSHIYKGRPEASPYLPHLKGVIPAITIITVGELYKWAYMKKWSPRNLAGLEDRFTQFLILPFDFAVAQQWARIQSAKLGRNVPQNDAWIAACAITYGCPLLTHNRKDFQDIQGLDVISYSPEQ